MIRSLTLFAHLVGMLTLFAALALELVGLESLRRSSTRGDGSPWIRVFRALPRVYGIALGVILVTGIYLAARVGVHGFAFVRASFGAMVLIGIAGGPLIRSRMRAIAQDEDPHAFRLRASDALLRASIRTRIALGLAIVYLMIAKVGVTGSLVALSVALVAGVITTVVEPNPSGA